MVNEQSVQPADPLSKPGPNAVNAPKLRVVQSAIWKIWCTETLLAQQAIEEYGQGTRKEGAWGYPSGQDHAWRHPPALIWWQVTMPSTPSLFLCSSLTRHHSPCSLKMPPPMEPFAVEGLESSQGFWGGTDCIFTGQTGKTCTKLCSVQVIHAWGRVPSVHLHYIRDVLSPCCFQKIKCGLRSQRVVLNGEKGAWFLLCPPPAKGRAQQPGLHNAGDMPHAPGHRNQPQHGLVAEMLSAAIVKAPLSPRVQSHFKNNWAFLKKKKRYNYELVKCQGAPWSARLCCLSSCICLSAFCTTCPAELWLG